MEIFLNKEKENEYFQKLMDKVDQAYQSDIVYPPRDELFACFKDLPASSLKVVILGQDPYHQKGQANGLAFSVNRGVKLPPSLKNIYQEMHDDVHVEIPSHGDLTDLKKQGVLLLNNVLSVVDSHPNSHKKLGWEEFMIHTLAYIDTLDQPIVFILWGKEAQSKKKYIHHPKRLILESVHPSPLSSYRGFFGSKPFSKANQFLEEYGVEPINWQVGE